MAKKRGFRNRILLFAVYVIFAIYFINLQISFLIVPEFVLKFNNLIFFVGGLLLLFAAFKQLMKTSRRDSIL